MKKWLLPCIFAIGCAAWVGVSWKPKTETGFATREFGELPVLLNGRIQPLDSVARNSLLQLRTKQTVALEHGAKLSATEWLMEITMNPLVADDRQVFRIDNLELLGMLKLPEDRKYFSFNELRPQFDEITRQGDRILDREEKKLSAPEGRTVFEKQLMRLYGGLQLYERLIVSLRPPGSDDFAAELATYQKGMAAGVAAVQASEAGKSYDKEAYDRLLQFLASFRQSAQFGYMLAVPPAHPQTSRDDWKNVGTTLMETARGDELSPAVGYYATMVSAYRHGDVDGFNRAVRDYRQWLGTKFAPEVKNGRHEFFFNTIAPFATAATMYVAMFFMACIALLTYTLLPRASATIRRSALTLMIVTWVLHTFGILFRMYLQGRPPVTNLYSSAIFIGWGVTLLCLILEGIFPLAIATAVGSLGGFVTLIIAHNLATSGDTMEMLRAVLDTNFWLATHVVVVTLGYAATFLAGTLAIAYILLGIFTPMLRQKLGRRGAQALGVTAGLVTGGVGGPAVGIATGVAVAKGFSRQEGGIELGKALSKMVYAIICFATLFSFVGTVLGGIWADQSWGRFWGWDPKENGALLIVLWNAIILHARWGGLVRERGVMALAVFGNIVTSFSWFGVNMLGVGLHSYGFMDAAFKWLMLFVVSQLAIIGLANLPLAWWKSFRREAPPVPPAGAPAPAR